MRRIQLPKTPTNYANLVNLHSNSNGLTRGDCALGSIASLDSGAVFQQQLLKNSFLHLYSGSLICAKGPIEKHHWVSNYFAHGRVQYKKGYHIQKVNLLIQISSDQGALVWIAPRAANAHTVMLDGSVDLIANRQSISFTQELQLETCTGLGLLYGGLSQYRISGNGSVGLQGQKIFRVDLSSSQQMTVDPKFFIARESSTQFEPVEPRAHIPVTPVKLNWTWIDAKIPNFPKPAKNAIDFSATWLVHAWRYLKYNFTYIVLGKRGEYLAQGPGTIFLSRP